MLLNKNKKFKQKNNEYVENFNLLYFLISTISLPLIYNKNTPNIQMLFYNCLRYKIEPIGPEPILVNNQLVATVIKFR